MFWVNQIFSILVIFFSLQTVCSFQTLKRCKDLRTGPRIKKHKSFDAGHTLNTSPTRLFAAQLGVNLLDVALDRSVIPRRTPLSLLYATAVMCLMALSTILRSAPSKATSQVISSTKKSSKKSFFNPFAQILPEFQYQLRIFFAKFQVLLEQVSGQWHTRFPRATQILPSEDWSVATLAERIRLDGPFLKHRFRLESPHAVLPLNLGQDIAICGLDSMDQVCQGSLHPLSDRTQAGYFELVTLKKSGRQLEQDNPFLRFIDSLAIGDEVAVKPGSGGLVYRGMHTPITDVSMVVAGPTNIIPVVQLTKELLRNSDSSVDVANVIWINEEEEDFVLFQELEEIYFKYHPKLDVSVLIIKDLFGHDLTKNTWIQETIPEFKAGAMLVLSGPDYFVQKMKVLLAYLGYPDDVIVVL